MYPTVVRGRRGVRAVSGSGCLTSAAPANALLPADTGAFATLGGRHVGVAGVRVAPAEAGVEGSGLRGVVAVVGVGDGELPQWSEVGLDRVGSGRVGRGEAQLDPVLLSTAPDDAAGGDTLGIAPRESARRRRHHWWR